jgi:hypothetical protein
MDGCKTSVKGWMYGCKKVSRDGWMDVKQVSRDIWMDVKQVSRDIWMDGCKNTHQIGALHFPTVNTLANFDQDKFRKLYPTREEVEVQKEREKEVVGVNLETVRTSPPTPPSAHYTQTNRGPHTHHHFISSKSI